jgi:hypothetical protein
MDYQKLIGSLLSEAKKGIRYKQFDPVVRALAIVCMAPFYVFAFFGVVYYYVSLFFYNALLSPCTYLEEWEKNRTKDMHPAPKSVVLFCTTTFIFFLRILIAFFSFFFYFQWFSLQITLYISTLGGIKFQPWINTATFEENVTWDLSPDKKTAKIFLIPALIFEITPIFLWILNSIFNAIVKGLESVKAIKFWLGVIDFCSILALISVVAYFVCTCIIIPCVYKKKPAVEETPETEEITE